MPSFVEVVGQYDQSLSSSVGQFTKMSIWSMEWLTIF